MVPKQSILSTTLFANSLTNPTDALHELARVVVQVPNYVYWKNRQLRYMGCNNNFARIAKLNSPADIAGKTDYDLSWSSESVERLIMNDRWVIKCGTELTSESTLLATDDAAQPIYIRTHRTPVHDEGGDVMGVMTTTVDISLDKQLEQQFNKLPDAKLMIEKIRAVDEAKEVVIDWDDCIRMCQNDLEFAKQILAGLVEQIKACQKTFAQAYVTKNITALRAELHSCIGGVCYMRLPQLERALKDLQTAAHTNSQDFNKLKITYLVVQKAMENFLHACERRDFS